MTKLEELLQRPDRTNGTVPAGRLPGSFRGRPLEYPIADVVVDVGWGRLIFGQTFGDPRRLAETLRLEEPGRRDIAMYLTDPHVVMAMAPQDLFLDPSHTFRLALADYAPERRRPAGFGLRQVESLGDAEVVHDLYKKRHMMPPSPEFVWSQARSRTLTYLVAVDDGSGEIIGVVTGIDHAEAFDDPENGSSLWALAVDPQAHQPGIGKALVRGLAEHFKSRGRALMDLSVMYDNYHAIRLYEKLGFKRVPVFALKRKNPYNEPLFVADGPEARLNSRAKVVIDEARRRGIYAEVLDEEAAYFQLKMGGAAVTCRESLSELTTAVAVSRCTDRAVTHRLLRHAGLAVPEQVPYADPAGAEAFLARHRRIVVKPARGEEGAGITVDVRTPEVLEAAVREARQVAAPVLLESHVEGLDLRVLVINWRVVAGAVRKPPEVIGTGQHTVRDLIEKQSRRRAAATGGESRIPIDTETRACVEAAGHQLDGVPPAGEVVLVRRTSNTGTGGSMYDVTSRLSNAVCRAAIAAARAIDIPVVGVDFIVPCVGDSAYRIIGTTACPPLTGHEPQPVAERFLDLLFPQSSARRIRS